MFGNISWGELFVLGGMGIAMVGKTGLPSTSRTAGIYVGRLVGLMQGARARADRFAGQNELRQLQNELRSGLRELDAVRAEMVVAVSSQGIVGRNLGSSVSGVNAAFTKGNVPILASSASKMLASASTPTTTGRVTTASGQYNDTVIRPLAPRSHAIGAVAEEEWTKQGIGFKSKAEHGAGDATGSVLLSSLLQQSLIFDQHDRVVQEQQQALQTKMDQKMEEREQNIRIAK